MELDKEYLNDFLRITRVFTGVKWNYMKKYRRYQLVKLRVLGLTREYRGIAKTRISN